MSRDILVNSIDPDPNQPRKYFDQTALDELAQSIDTNGLAVPILLRPAGKRFTIVHGERRWRAVKSLGWETIPAEVRDLEPDAALWLALVENVQRNNLSPIEEAKAYQHRLDNGFTQVQLGQRIGKGQSYIATKLRYLKLPERIQQSLDKREISEGHAKQILRLKGHYYLQKWADHIARDLSVSALAEVVSKWLDYISITESLHSGQHKQASNLFAEHFRAMPGYKKQIGDHHNESAITAMTRGTKIENDMRRLVLSSAKDSTDWTGWDDSTFILAELAFLYSIDDPQGHDVEFDQVCLGLLQLSQQLKEGEPFEISHYLFHQASALALNNLSQDTNPVPVV